MIVKIGNIKPNPNNPRIIKDERFAKQRGYRTKNE